ncbi:MAG TPA: AMP-binding protein [Kofleriaceae bacterium]
MKAPPETVLAALFAAADRYGDRPALHRRVGQEWKATSWAEYRAQVELASRGLIALGVPAGAGVVILGANRPEWFVADLAAIAAGALPAGIYTTSTPEQVRYIAEHCEAVVAVVENRQLLERSALLVPPPALRAVVLMEGEGGDDGFTLGWEELLARGRQSDPAELERRLAAQRPEDFATLIYTSGTTGPPKAVMLTHRNLTWTAARVATDVELRPDDRIVSYLPLSHIAEQIVSLHAPIQRGSSAWFAASIEALGETLRSVQPTFFLGVPRVWEKMQAAMQAAGAANPPWKRRLAAWARRVGLAAARAAEGGHLRPWNYALADRLVFHKVRQKLGFDHIRLSVVSAAPVARETLEFFFSLGMPIYEVYGMSECCGPATFSHPGHFTIGSAGPALEGSEIALAPDGEVLIRGPHVFRGYFKNAEATAETLDAEGWLHSGDVGELDERGFLRITDRKKELIITAGGKNLAPQHLEGRLKQIPAVSQAVAIGDRRPYVVALLAIDPQRVTAEAERAGSPARTAAEAAVCPHFRAHVGRQVEDVNRGLARYESIKRFALLPCELSVDNGELTPTLKLKRRVIAERHRETIEALYA